VTVTRVPLCIRLLHILLALALLAPLMMPLAVRAESPLDGVARQALADLGLPEPLTDDQALEEAWGTMQDAPGRLHTLCMMQTEPDGSMLQVNCSRRIGQPRPELGEDTGYICGYNLSALLFDLQKTEEGDPEMVSGLLQMAREGWEASGELPETAELSESSFEGGAIHSYTYRSSPKERRRASIWGDGHVVIMTDSREEASLNVINDPTTLPCTLDAFRTDPPTEDLLVALYRAAAAAGILEGEVASVVVDPEPTPSPADARLAATCEFGFNRNAPLLLYVNMTYDGEPLPHAQVVVAPTGEWEGAQWADLVRLHDDARGSFVVGETATQTDGGGQARLAAKLLYDEVPQPILRGQPIRGAFTVRAPGLPHEPEGPPLEARCDVALDYVAVGHEPAWGPLLVIPLGADAPAIAIAPGDYGTGDFPLYMGDRVVLGYDEHWGDMGDHPGAGAVLLLTYVDGTRAEFRIETVQDERLPVREGDVWHPARAEFMIGRALERDVVGAVTWTAFMAGAYLTESLIEQKVYAAVVASGPVGWKAMAITWVVMTTGKKALELMLTEPDPDAVCRPGRLFVPDRYSNVRLRERCGRRVGFEMQIRSLVELEVGAEGTTVRTHAGDPAVRDASGNLQPLPPGQALHIDDADLAGAPAPFEPGTPWWDPALLAPLGETSTEGAVIWPVAEAIDEAPSVMLELDQDGDTLLWVGAICGCSLLLAALLGVILLLERWRRRARADGAPANVSAPPDASVPVQSASQLPSATPRDAATGAPDAWWVARGGASPRGPYTWAQLCAAARNGDLRADQWVYDPRIAQWVPISHYRDLCPAP
jgi:hypothetical protein